MSHYLIREIEVTPNLDVRTWTAVVGGGGEGRLQQLVLRERGAGEEKVTADALFVLIGAHPHTDWLPQEIARNASGSRLVGTGLIASDPDQRLAAVGGGRPWRGG
jgi:thioredoxin reductase (NADPH)